MYYSDSVYMYNSDSVYTREMEMSLFSQKHITTDILYTEGHWARYTQKWTKYNSRLSPPKGLARFHVCLTIVVVVIVYFL